MYKFITIRCRTCGSVMYNLPATKIKKHKLVNLVCEDCMDSVLKNTEMGVSFEYPKHYSRSFN